MTVRLSTVIMCHPSRRGSARRVAERAGPLIARVIEDPDPTGCPSPLRTAKLAWGAVANGATHHLVLQDDVELCDGFADHARALVRRHPRAAIALAVLWNSPYNAYRVRQAAVTGHCAVRLAPWEWVPTLGLILPADLAGRLAAHLRGIADEQRDDDEHIAEFCARHGIDVLAPVPHLLDHGTGPSVAGNDDHGLRRAAVPATGPIDPSYWDGAVLAEPGLALGRQYGVELVASSCYLRLWRPDRSESTEQPFSWPWRPWSALLGVPAEALTVPGLAAAPLDPRLAVELWAAGFLLGSLAPAPARRTSGHAVRAAAAEESLRSWIAAGLRRRDLERLGATGTRAAADHLRSAVAAGRRHRGARLERPPGAEHALVRPAR